MNNSNSYYQINRERLLKQAKNRYLHKGGKEQARNCYHDKVGGEEAKKYYENKLEINVEQK